MPFRPSAMVRDDALTGPIAIAAKPMAVSAIAAHGVGPAAVARSKRPFTAVSAETPACRATRPGASIAPPRRRLPQRHHGSGVHPAPGCRPTMGGSWVIEGGPMDARSSAHARRDAQAAEALEAVIDAQRAEQRNAESLLSRLGELRDGLVARGDGARARLDALDREIATAAERVSQALRLQAELTMRLGRAQGGH